MWHYLISPILRAFKIQKEKENRLFFTNQFITPCTIITTKFNNIILYFNKQIIFSLQVMTQLFLHLLNLKDNMLPKMLFLMNFASPSSSLHMAKSICFKSSCIQWKRHREDFSVLFL